MASNQNNNNTKKSSARSSKSSTAGVSTLASLLRYLIDTEITVELKQHGKIFSGKLKRTDAYMNIVLENAKTIDTDDNNDVYSRKRKFYSSSRNNNSLDHNFDREENSIYRSDPDFQLLHIRGPSIRYIHLPSNINIPSMIKMGMDRERAAVDKYKRGKRKT